MELNFLGGAGEVGRSCFSLTSGETTVYLDCGLKMEPHMQLPFLQNAKRPNAIILSHSHLDHCGAIPTLYQHSAPVTYCTTPTLSISNILYDDTIKIASQKNLPSPFSKADLTKALQHFSALGYKNEFTISKDIKFSFIDAGHIIGSSQIELEIEKKKVVYTGDLKLSETRMHKGAEAPTNVDTLIIETTYGEKEQNSRKEVEDQFVNAVQDVIDQHKTALVPCFAVGRTQEILTLLSEKNFRGNIYIEGMGERVNEVYYQYSGYLKNANSFRNALQKTKPITTKEERRQALSGGNVVISTAGMIEGGPILSYLQLMEKNQLDGKIFIVGYQAEHTNGRKLLHGQPIDFMTKTGPKRMKVNLPVKQFEFSAHADQAELIQYVKTANPEKVICVHGDDTQSFANNLKEEGFNATAPKIGDRIKI